MRPSKESGFTLVELLVVISIIGLLLAILLPAVQGAREAARRATCGNNMRQISLAAIQYTSTYETLPSGRYKGTDTRYCGPNPPCSSPYIDKSVHIKVLPFMEQTALYNSINQSTVVFSPENFTCHNMSVSSFACPSDPSAATEQTLDNPASLGFPTTSPSWAIRNTSYAGMFGSFDTFALPWENTNCKVDSTQIAQNDGCINDLQDLRLASITDGTSNTVMFVEKITKFSLARGSAMKPQPEFGWVVTGNLGDTLCTSLYPPNLYLKAPTAAERNICSSASSLHPGGFNIAMADGSIRSVKDSISTWVYDYSTGSPVGAKTTSSGSWINLPPQGVWQALTTRSGGETVQQTDF